jgi:hypothetical protein
VCNRPLNKFVTEYPFAIGVDLFFCAALLAISGGYHSPYYLYALSPLLAGAFFFQLRGALASSVAFTPLYLLANLPSAQPTSTADNISLMTQLAGIWFIPILFAYPSTLLKDVNRSEDLSKA